MATPYNKIGKQQTIETFNKINNNKKRKTYKILAIYDNFVYNLVNLVCNKQQQINTFIKKFNLVLKQPSLNFPQQATLHTGTTTTIPTRTKIITTAITIT